jgi:nucleoid DNA-binding protein
MPKSKKGSKEKGMTKSQVISELASKTNLTKSQVNDIFASLMNIIESELKGHRPITIPGLVKIDVRRKEATKARPGINPFTGEKITIKAKPAKNVIKVKALKGLKEIV